MVRYSALTDRGRAALDEALAEAVQWVREREGVVKVGTGRLTVQRRLEKLRDQDVDLPVHERKHRTISQSKFRRICDRTGSVSSTDQLLHYLHTIGTVFYQQGQFGDAIILDQGWALDAIYAVFHGEKCVRKLPHQNGRFTCGDLADWVWRQYSRVGRLLSRRIFPLARQMSA